MLTILADAGPNVAQQIASDFGWKFPLFVAQVINFCLVLYVLKKFAFGPIQEILNQRRAAVEEGERKLALIEKRLDESEKTTAEMIEKANADAKRLVDEAKESGERISEQKSQEAIASAKNIIAKAEQAAQAERETMEKTLKKEFGQLVIKTTAAVTGKSLTKEDQKRLNDQALKAVSKN